MKIFFLIFLFTYLPVFSGELPKAEEVRHALPLADTEADSQLIVGGCINVLTGSYNAPQHDLTLTSAEPLSLIRLYAHGKFSDVGFHSGWKHTYLSEASCSVNLIEIDSKGKQERSWRTAFVAPSGSATYYEALLPAKADKNVVVSPFGNYSINFLGLTNTGGGLISGQTNLKNNLCVFDREKKSLLVGTGSGHNYYLNQTAHKKSKLFRDTEVFTYRLDKEQKPNGNLITYKYDKNDDLIGVMSTDHSGSILFGSLLFFNADRHDLKKDSCINIRAHDGRIINLKFERRSHKDAQEKNQFYIKSVMRPDEPFVQYDYVNSSTNDCSLLSKVLHPEGRYIALDYYTSGDEANRVHHLKAPVGPNGAEANIYNFKYDLSRTKDSKTEVMDAYGHKTSFFFTPEQRIKTIKRYLGTGNHTLYSKEQYQWGAKETADEANLLSHTIENSAGNVICRRAYQYDKKGNVLREDVSGDLTGKGQIDTHTIIREYQENDAYNLLLKEIEPNGKETTYHYKPNSNLLVAKYTKANHHYIREFFNYDPNIAVLTQKIQDNGTGSDINDLTGVTQRLITYILPNFSGGGIGLPKEIEERYLDITTRSEVCLSKTVLNYDAYGRVIQKDLFDAGKKLKISTSFAYDNKGNIVKESNSVGQTIEYRYDENNNRIYTKGPNHDVETYQTYDLANRCTSIEERHANGDRLIKTITYDLLGNKVSSTDIYGHTTHYTYDEFNRCIKVQMPQVSNEDGQPITPTETFSYDILGRVVAHTDAKGFTTSTTYTLWGKPACIKYSDGTEEKFEYSLDGHLVKKIEKNGTYTIYTNDSLGRKIRSETYQSGNLLYQESFSYNAFQLISETDANGNVTLHSYDGAGRKISEQHANETMTTYTYDSCGRLFETSTRFGDQLEDISIHIIEYDALDRMLEEHTENGLGVILYKKQYRYDIVGNCTQITLFPSEPASTKISYDSHSQPLVVEDALGNKTIYSYNYAFANAQGQKVLQTSVTDAKGIKTIETYDFRGVVTNTEKFNTLRQLLSKELVRYDANGNSACWIESIIIDGKEKGIVTNTKQYGPLNRLETTIEAKGSEQQKITQHCYNAFGQEEKIIKADGVQLLKSYDPESRLVHLKSTDGRISYFYTYDANDNLVSVIDEINKTTTHRSYDFLDRLKKETLANGLSFQFTYDSLNRKKQILLPDNSSIRYCFDAQNLLEISRFDASGKLLYNHEYKSYTLTGKPIQIKLAGKAGIEERHYDLLGRRIATLVGSWKQSECQYDPVGNLLSYQLLDKQGKANFQFSYDDLCQVIQEEGHQYKYDSLNNRLAKDGLQHSHNALQQLLYDGQKQYIYDINGNLIEKRDGKNIVKYSYDALDRLISVATDKNQTRYTYDFEHRRLSKEHFAQQKGKWVSVGKQNFLYIDQNEVGSSQNGKVKELRILGEGLGAEIGASIAIELDGSLYVPIHNLSGDICGIIAAKNGEVQHFRYSVFGEGTSTLPWGFASKRYDPETGFIYFGRRYYNPDIGRWITPDPLGIADGPNLYAYVHNNPLTHVDPYGLFTSYNFSWGANPGPYYGSSFNNSRNFSYSYWQRGSSSRMSYFSSTMHSFNTGMRSGFNNFYRGFTSGFNRPNSALHFENNFRKHGLSYTLGNAYGSVIGELGRQSSKLSELMGHTPPGLTLAAMPTGPGGSLTGRSQITNIGNRNPSLPKNSLKQIFQDGKKSGRYRFEPNNNAVGEHSVFRRNQQTNKITKYETFEPQTNAFDPNKWKSVKRYDGPGGDPHFNKKLKIYVETPHIHDANFPGKIRSAQPWEIPN